MKKFVKFEVLFILILWMGLTVFAWFSPAKEISVSERRPLDQMPEVTLETIGSGKFMSKFESYTLDQSPLRDSWRTLKALTAFNIFRQKDNNDIYISQGQAASLDYPLNQASLDQAGKKFGALYEKYFKDMDAEFFFSIVPDKGYYLAQAGGYPAMDYTALEAYFKEVFSYARYIDLFGTLSAEDYYATDSHWKQENLSDTVQALADAMGIAGELYTDYEAVTSETPYYGVYYGQAALPLQPDTVTYLRNEKLDACTVFNAETNKTTGIYDVERLTGRDPYEVFLSGAAALLTIENPNANSDKQLIVFRDSYGSSLIPLLVGAYEKVTVVDTRYVHPDFLAQFVDFASADHVLLMYSTTLLNNSSTLK